MNTGAGRMTGNTTELANRLKNHDPEALAELYDIYGRFIYTLIWRIVHDRHCAEDLVQDCFLRVWSRAGQFDAEHGQLGAWLVVVARNCAFDYLKSAQARMAGASSQTVSERIPLVIGEDPIEEDLIDAELVEGLRNALTSLPATQQKVLTLAYFDELSQAEIAAKLNEPLGTVKSRIRSALSKLRSELLGCAA